ncbi:GreA/GreB family elongation factor [Stakelama pacifica]|uniref:Transcription elongation GreA/GreB family factor n=1 Tax=Stakelama pacifica TaxID=517720 RepID=A0A4R6FXB7_9SPHN|nr:GreA/GreB family elongation factor [Stakelama pacifica]TDN85655.1 transcription elongation GreA/GreB family factor [Stakelama pacifica]GGO92020.1 transcription elongation factor GreB [Stakelama pacifica]
MSVAFRRDSDEEHREPEFELPIPVGPNLVTERGLALIGEKMAALKAAVAAESDEASTKKLRRELRYWSTQAATAQIAPPPAPGEAGLGSLVTVRREGREHQFRIVGHDEADPAAKLLAFTAPLARAVMGAMAGDLVDFGGKAESLEVVAVA